MSIIENRFPILKDPTSGLVVLVLTLSTILNAWIFQEWIELPKLIAWLIGFGLILIVLVLSQKRLSFQYSKAAVGTLLVLAGILILNPFFSLDAINSLVGVYPRYTNSILFFISWIIFIISLGFFTRVEKINFAKLLAFLGFVIALWGVFQNFGVGYYGGLYEGVRAAVPSFLGNPNFSAMFVVVTIPLQIWFLFSSESKKSAYYYFVTVGVSVLGLILFNSRGAFLAMVFAIFGSGLVAFLLKKYKVGLLIFLALGISLLGTFFYYNSTRVNVPAGEAVVSAQTADDRLLVWDLAFSEIKNSPLVGSGVGNFFLAFRANTNPALANHEWFDDAHNVLLQFFASTGIPAGIVFLIFIGLIVYWCIKDFLINKEGYPLIIVTAIITWFIVGSFTPVGLPNWLLLAVLIGNGLTFAPKMNTCNLTGKFKALFLTFGCLFLLVGLFALGSELALWRSGIAYEAKQYHQSEVLSKISSYTNPFNSNARLSVIRSLVDQEKYVEADMEIQKFINQHSRSSGVYRSATDYYVEMYQKTKDESYKNKAESSIQNMLANNNNYVEPLTSAAANLIKLGEWKKSEALTRRAVVLDANSYNSWVLLAQAQYNLNNKQGMLFSLENSFRAYPFHPTIFYLNTMEAATNIQSVPFPYTF